MGSKKQYPLIDYTSRDFNSIKEDLVDYAKRYYPNSFKDFNESFLDTAIEYDNVIKLGRQMGYRFNPAASSVGEAIFYIIIPAVTVGTGPDTNYMPILKRGTEVSSIDNLGFILNEDVDFSDPNKLCNPRSGTSCFWKNKPRILGSWWVSKVSKVKIKRR